MCSIDDKVGGHGKAGKQYKIHPLNDYGMPHIDSPIYSGKGCSGYDCKKGSY